jgi:hypothetical protein
MPFNPARKALEAVTRLSGGGPVVRSGVLVCRERGLTIPPGGVAAWRVRGRFCGMPKPSWRGTDTGSDAVRGDELCSCRQPEPALRRRIAPIFCRRWPSPDARTQWQADDR